jgi:hypothetical protein
MPAHTFETRLSGLVKAAGNRVPLRTAVKGGGR